MLAAHGRSLGARGAAAGSSRRHSRLAVPGRARPVPAARTALIESIQLGAAGEVQFDAVANAPWPAVDVLGEYTVRPPGSVPGSAPHAVLPSRPDSLTRSTKPVVLCRDTNGWCPFCERVWLALEEKEIPYDCILIELYNKPEWYKEIVPTSLVPAVAFTEDGALVWESKDILLDLERRFPQAAPLLPTGEDARQAALEFMQELEDCGLDKHGYAFMTGGRMIGRAAAGANGSAPEPSMAELQAAFEQSLGWFENTALAKHEGGPYLLGEEFSLLDVMVISTMERLAAGLPKFRGFSLKSNPDYPRTGAWLAAIAARPAYQKVCSDDQTLQLLFQRMMGMSAGAAAAAGGGWA